MIYCFTGTGNSEFVAKRIAEKTGDEICFVYECIRDGKSFSASDGEKLIFVTPTHAWRIPRIVEKWIEDGDKPADCKAYFVMTCGSNIGAADAYLKPLCEKKGFEYMGVAEVVMPENYVAMFPVPEEDEATQIVRDALPVIEETAGHIIADEKLPLKKYWAVGKLKSGITNDLFYKFSVKADDFKALDTCTSCGKCERVCITHNIKLTDGRPTWGDNCIHCMRCICDCPAKAIEYGKKSRNKPRYHCPEI